MVQRGQKSAAQLAVVPSVSGLPDLPASPAYLPEEQREIWNQVVNSLKPGWFGPETFPVLEAYVNHCANARMLGRRIAKAVEGGPRTVDEVDRLLSLQRQQSDIIKRLATALRLTPHSSRSAAATKQATPGVGRRPWDPVLPDPAGED
jgi:hypothetical protein